MREASHVVVNIAGDSGDGIQLTGSQFAHSTALVGNNLATLPNFPAEIRAPQGTVHGVSGFQIHFSSQHTYTAGDSCDVFVAMNAAALKSQLDTLKMGGLLIVNLAGFSNNNLRLAGYETSPLDGESLSNFRVIAVDISKIIKELFTSSTLSTKEKERTKNMFVLGMLFWMYGRDASPTIAFLKKKFNQNEVVCNSNIAAIKAGMHYAETSEIFQSERTLVKKVNTNPGTYRSITGSQALSLGLVAAAQLSGLSLFYSSYPITPASDILHTLSLYADKGVFTFQAEDEIAAVSSAIGASYGGSLGVTGTSGPGMALKTEAIGLATMLELPLVICNIQRGGPSTGLPTKTEQSDLMQALHGRNGETPLPVLAAKSPADCFHMAIEAVRIAVEYMTPVILLSDGYIANGTEIWSVPSVETLQKITPKWWSKLSDKPYLPYKKDELGVREWSIPGMKGGEHRLGGLEKEQVSGNVSYDPINHEKMVEERSNKIAKVAQSYPDLEILGEIDRQPLLLITWGSTYGVVRSVVERQLAQGVSIAHLHLSYLNPFHLQVESALKKASLAVTIELNQGQLARTLRATFGVYVRAATKVQGLPFSEEDVEKIIHQQSPHLV